MVNIFSKEELVQFNEVMLGRGMPVTEDGVGYNKADYGACATYYYGLSDAQYADLAKRLVKYTNTQLHVDRSKMKDTAEHYASLDLRYDRRDGISIDITEEGTLFSFSYNEQFVEVIKKLPVGQRKYDNVNKHWIVSHIKTIPLLNELWTIGADVDGALKYAVHHPLIEKAIDEEIEKLPLIKVKIKEDKALIKFDYNEEILQILKDVSKEKKYNPTHKYWTIDLESLDKFGEVVCEIANMRLI